ncbi:MAG: hypothetical protein ACI4DS_03775 [Eubacterium sp.]
MRSARQFVKELSHSRQILALCIVYSIYVLLRVMYNMPNFSIDFIIDIIICISLWSIYINSSKGKYLKTGPLSSLRVALILKYICKMLIYISVIILSVLSIIIPDIVRNCFKLLSNKKFIDPVFSFVNKFSDFEMIVLGIGLILIMVSTVIFVSIYYIKLIRLMERCRKTLKNDDADNRIPMYIVIYQIVMACIYMILLSISLLTKNVLLMIMQGCIMTVYIIMSFLIYQYKRGMTAIVNERPYIVNDDNSYIDNIDIYNQNS